MDQSDCDHNQDVPPEDSGCVRSPNDVGTSQWPSKEEALYLSRIVCTAAAIGDQELILETLSTMDSELIGKILVAKGPSEKLPPLALGVVHGHLCVVQLLLLKKFNVDIEQNIGVYHNKVCYNSVLSVAAMKGSLDIVKCLVDGGANVNSVSHKSRSALHAACYFGHLDVVQYLLERDARLSLVDGTGHTCLMTACMKNKTDVVGLLLDKGADPNQKSPTEQTAMHVAAINDAVGSARLLLKRGAKMTQNTCGHTPWVEAILRRSKAFISFILGSPAISRQEKINTLELWGAVCISNQNVDEGFQHLYKAMTERFQDPLNILHKFHRHIVPTLASFSESNSPADLQSRRHDQIAMMVESVLIFERVLGPGHVKHGLEHLYWHLCDALMKSNHYVGILAVWNHAWKYTGNLEFNRFRKHLNMLNALCADGLLPASIVIAGFLNLALTTVERFPFRRRLIDFSTVGHLYISLLPRALDMEEDEDERRQAKEVAKRLVNVLKPLDGWFPVLHGAIHTLAWKSNILTQLNTSGVVKVLLDSGADVNAVDSRGNTPLHKVAFFRRTYEDEMQWLRKKEELCSVLRVLMKRGAHADSRNKGGRTPIAVGSPTVRNVLREYLPVSLKCLAASTIVRHKVPYIHRVPKVVQDFIELHFPGQKTS